MATHDKQFFSQLYKANYKRLLCAAIRIVHNFAIAEELTNETFFILLTQLDNVRRHPNPYAWLHTVLMNLALNELKKQHRYMLISLEDLPELGYEEDFVSFHDYLPNKLSDTDKEILILRYQYRLTCREIADILNISHEASRARLSRAKRHYAELIIGDEIIGEKEPPQSGK